MINKIGFKVLILPLAGAFVVMMSVLYIKPAYDQMQSFRKSQAEKQQQLDVLQKQNQELAILKNKWNSMEEERTLVETALPAKNDVENYISELYGRASRSGILLNGITSDEKISTSEAYICGSLSNPSVSAADLSGTDGSPASISRSCVNSVSVKLTASGSWDQIVNFFKYLEDTNRIANITSVSIKSNQKSNSDEQSPSDLVNATVALSVYYKQKSEVNSPSVASDLVSSKGINEDVIKKLNEIVFAPYVAPDVSESGERNIFK